MFETEESSVASSFGDQDDMDHFLDRCSICFDAQLDMCLEFCRDQYCVECFQRYIIEVVKSSWGLSVTLISCPVCNELIPKREWSQYVPQHIIDIYDKFNKPYRSYIRACPHCDTDIVPCVHSSEKPSNRLFCDLMENMLHACPKGEKHKNHTEHIAVKRWITIYKRQDWSDSKLLGLYKRIMQDVTTFEQNHIQERYAYQISLSYMNLCENPEIWKQVQFAHIALFPDMKCPNCKISVCLHCGYGSHFDIECKENMSRISTTLLDKDTKTTVKWKLQHSRQCPNCSIMINRDEGCNKVDCSYCGFCFCWACRSSWSEGCGFYRCSNTTDDLYLNQQEGSSQDKTELGVPNIKNIQARLIVSNMELD